MGGPELRIIAVVPTTRKSAAVRAPVSPRRLAQQQTLASARLERVDAATSARRARLEAASSSPRAYSSAMSRMRYAQRAIAMVVVAFALVMSVSYVIPNAQAVEGSDGLIADRAPGDAQAAGTMDAAFSAPAIVRDGYSITLAPPPPPPKAKAIPASVRFSLTPSSSSADLQWPVAGGTKIASGYGPRSCSGCSSFHEGVDLSAASGSAVWAVAAGTVIETSNPGYSSLGVYAKIQHIIDGEVITTTYAHMLDGSRTVAVGDQVTPGQVIGAVGCTGRCTGTHLHFEVRNGGVAVDPVVWFAAKLG